MEFIFMKSGNYKKPESRTFSINSKIHLMKSIQGMMRLYPMLLFVRWGAFFGVSLPAKASKIAKNKQ
jgi:hypothetical protein